jgi:hypothetical protein
LHPTCFYDFVIFSFVIQFPVQSFILVLIVGLN